MTYDSEVHHEPPAPSAEPQSTPGERTQSHPTEPGWYQFRFHDDSEECKRTAWWDGKRFSHSFTSPVTFPAVWATDFRRLVPAAQVGELVSACREAIAAIDEAYNETGHIKVARSSHQRMRIERALAAIETGGTG